MVDMWDYSADFDRDTGVAGYRVEASDGHIGKVDEATYKAGDSYVIVDTGPWILGRKVLLPAGVITSIDHDHEVVRVDRSKGEIKDAPEFVDMHERTESFRRNIGEYYGGAYDF